MTEGQETAPQPSNPEFTKTDKLWGAGSVAAAIGILLLVALRPESIRASFQFLLDNLPLTLPWLTVVMAFALDPRDLRTVHGWLRLTGPIALGLVSFAIWYYVAGQTVNDFIFISPEKVLTKDYSLLLLISAFIWAGFCFVVGIISDQKLASDRTWLRVRFFALAFSVAFLVMPFALFERKTEVETRLRVSLDLRRYNVAIPYRDPSLNQHLGRSTDPLTQVHTYVDILAKTTDAAVRTALDSFRVSPASHQFLQPSQRGPNDSSKRVDVLESWIVAQERR